MKALSILVILFGIFATACGGFWEMSFLIPILGNILPVRIVGLDTGLLLMPFLSILIGFLIIWGGTRRFSDILWMSKGWKIFFGILFVLAGIFQILLALFLGKI